MNIDVKIGVPETAEVLFSAESLLPNPNRTMGLATLYRASPIGEHC